MNEVWSAMILTGGKSSRFGSDKSKAMLGSTSLLDRLTSTLPNNVDIVIVGPEFDNGARPITFTQEDPVGGGPVAAVSAGLKEIGTEFVVIIATDMPFASSVAMELVTHIPDIKGGLTPIDIHGVRQTLCSLYRVSALREALARLGSPEGQSMRNLSALLDIEEIRLPSPLEGNLLDVDTQADLESAIALGKVLETNL